MKQKVIMVAVLITAASVLFATEAPEEMKLQERIEEIEAEISDAEALSSPYKRNR